MTRRRNASGAWTRRSFLLAAVSGVAAASTRWSGELDALGDLRDAHRKACRWLWGQQANDGAWKSSTYGLLKSGQAYTPFVLHSLMEADRLGPASHDSQVSDGKQRAFAFLRRHVNQDGAIGMSDPDMLEYPVYATSFALACHAMEPGRRADGLVGRMADYLLASQFQDDAGFGPEHPAHGGWGFGGRATPRQPGHMDLTHTRCALQALRASERLSPQASERAMHFLKVVQRWPGAAQPSVDGIQPAAAEPPCDGGFYFSPVVVGANKGRTADSLQGKYFRSYASATSDGVLALLACGVESTNAQLNAATAWLRQNHQWPRPDGVPLDDPEPWAEAIRFNYWATRAEASQALRLTDWRDELAELLCGEQLADGRFQNRQSPLMKEDDPLLATALAIRAINAALLAR